MPGSLLKDDLQGAIKDQLTGYARGLTVVGDTAADLARAGRGRIEDVQSQLTDYANQVSSAAQQSGVYQVGQQAQQAVAGAAQQPLQVLSDYAAQVAQQPVVQPPVVQPQQGPDVSAIAGAPAALPQPLAGAKEWVEQRGQDVLGTVSQFGDKELTAAEAYAACGPAAAVRFGQLYGRQPTLREATDLAKTVGWTEQGGMAGLGSESQLFDKMGIRHRMVGADWSALAQEAQSGNPVTISTPGHYFTADNYDPNSGAFHVGSSGTDLRGGAEWMTAEQMEGRMGRLQGGMAVDHPNVPAGSPLSSGQTATPAGGIDTSSPQAFARSFAPYAKYAADKLGIDPTWVTAMAASESNYGKAPGNELFGVKGTGTAGAQTLQTHEGEYGGTTQTAAFAAYTSPLDAVNAWVDLLQKRYQGAVGAPDLPSFVHGLKQGGYFTAAEPEYLGIVQSIKDRVGGTVQDTLAAGGQAISGAAGAAGNVVAGARRAAGDVIEAGQHAVARAPIVVNT
ncbi:MAG TPA: glucosaminidase domain-containing protein, partial [Chloroflexota bacterium]|nr:glucosaminidase domain-containing protein [Chloroflexota bacterium]